jgi:hypothetical protein
MILLDLEYSHLFINSSFFLVSFFNPLTTFHLENYTLLLYPQSLFIWSTYTLLLQTSTSNKMSHQQSNLPQDLPTCSEPISVSKHKEPKTRWASSARSHYNEEPLSAATSKPIPIPGRSDSRPKFDSRCLPKTSRVHLYGDTVAHYYPPGTNGWEPLHQQRLKESEKEIGRICYGHWSGLEVRSKGKWVIKDIDFRKEEKDRKKRESKVTRETSTWRNTQGLQRMERQEVPIPADE